MTSPLRDEVWEWGKKNAPSHIFALLCVLICALFCVFQFYVRLSVLPPSYLRVYVRSSVIAFSYLGFYMHLSVLPFLLFGFYARSNFTTTSLDIWCSILPGLDSG